MTNELDVVRDEAGHVLEGPFKHLRVMERRKNFLLRRVNEAAKKGSDLTHDRHEAEALEWAINLVYQSGMLPERE